MVWCQSATCIFNSFFWYILQKCRNRFGEKSLEKTKKVLW